MAQLIIQPNDTDCYFKSNAPTENYDSSYWLAIGVVLGPGIERGLLKFDFSPLPNRDSINLISAVLEAYVLGSTDEGRTLKACRLTRSNWTKDGATWNTYDGSNNWSSSGGDYTTTDEASATTADLETISFDVLNQVEYAIINTSNILHILMKDNSEAEEHYTNISSSREETESLRPKLTLTYEYINGFWFGNG